MSQKSSLILGGARSGKSRFAVELASQRSDKVLFVATAEPGDEEMQHRIRQHRLSRPPHWRTLEAPMGVGHRLAQEIQDAEVVVLDCLTLLVANLLGQAADPTRPEEIDIRKAEKCVAKEIEQILEAMATLDTSFIIVSNEVGLGLVPANRLGRLYRDLIGWANQQIAERATEVYLMVAGLSWKLKG